MKLFQILRLIQEMSELMKNWKKPYPNRKKKKQIFSENRKPKSKKKEKKKHLEVIQAMKKATQLKLLFNKNQVLRIVQGTPKYLTEVMSIHQKTDLKEKILVEKEYKKLFTESLKDQILEALDIDDDNEELQREDQEDI